MKYLYDDWDKIEPVLRTHPVLLCLDYDGTLTPIVRKPCLERIPENCKKVLETLSRTKDVTTLCG